MQHAMGACRGWCQKGLTQEEYRLAMAQAAMILEGRSQQLARELEADMEKVKRKSAMKAYYAAAGIPTASFISLTSCQELKASRKFI